MPKAARLGPPLRKSASALLILIFPSLAFAEAPPAGNAPVATRAIDAGESNGACILAQATTSRPEKMLEDARVRRWWLTMGWGLVIIVAFFAGAGAIVVFSRRYQAYLQRKRSSPTVVDDVWAMHVAPDPDDVLDDGVGDSDGGSAGGGDDSGD